MEIQSTGTMNAAGFSDVRAEPVVPKSQGAPMNTDGSNGASSQQQDHTQVLGTKNLNPDQIKKAVDSMNNTVKGISHSSCQFAYNEKLNRISIKVIDDETKEVIMEVPPEKTLDIIEKSLELAGLLVDEKR